MSDTPETEDAEFLLPPIFAPQLALGASASGLAEMFKVARIDAENYMKPKVDYIVDPVTEKPHVVVVSKEGVKWIDDSFFDDVRGAPRFRRGSATMTSIASFIAHVNRFGDADSAIFADDNRSAPHLTAVLDYYRADTLSSGGEDGLSGLRVHGEYRFGKHRTAFAFPLSEEWQAWNGMNGLRMSMVQFALFIEKRIGDIALAGDDFPEDVQRFINTRGGPKMIADFAQLVELSRGLKIHEDAVIEETNVLASGEGHIRFTSEHRTRNAAGDTVKVPTLLFITIPVFNRGAFYRIAAALNYRKTPEGIVFWFDLHRPDRSFDHAFNEAVEKVDAETEAQVFFGAPEA